jgi:hypothetical protein
MADQPIQPDQPASDPAKPEGLLFHYTRQVGLDGILSSNKIRATHYRFLNDTMERQLGLDAYKNAICKNARKHFGSEKSAEVLAEYFRRSYTNALDAYTVSFCTSYAKGEYQEKGQDEDGRGGDRLSQWRGYATGVQGYCLAFDFELVQQIQQLAPNRCYHSFCNYSEGSIDQLVETHVGELFKSQLFSPEDLESIDGLHTALKQNLETKNKVTEFIVNFLLLCGVFKHVGFQEENEYRVVRFMLQGEPNPEKVLFRPDNAPYIEIPLNLFAEYSPLRAIFVGPSADRDRAACILRIQLRQMGLSQVEVVESKIPYRNW